MSWTKRQFVTHALDEIGLGDYVFDMPPEALEVALRKLDGMMATWNGKGIRLSYPMPSSPENSDLDTETTVPDSANEAIYLNLAIRLAPSYGKAVSMDTKMNAKAAYDVLLSRAAMPTEMNLNCSIPMGAGHKLIDQPFMRRPADTLLAGQDGQIEFN